MGKLRTHQGTAKRIRVTGRKRLLRGRQLGGHLMVHKDPNRKRSLRETRAVDPADLTRVERLLPYR
jgi:large subunit ribosomal protein L35